MERADGPQTREVREGLDDLPIGILHLGTKTRLLEEAGYQRIGDVKNLDAAVLMRIPSVGRRTTNELVRNRAALHKAVDSNGAVDWSAYCAATDICLLPARPPADGHELLDGLPAFLDALVEELDDEVLTAVLCDRICRPPGKQKTLEEIGATSSPVVTRERVRQKERRLLEQITGGLLNDSYDGLGIHFHPEFARWWKSAADALADVDEIEVGGFVKLLAEVWAVPEAAVIEHLPTLVAIVTGEPQMAAAFRAFSALDPRLFKEKSGNLRHIPVLGLRMGKDTLRLIESDLHHVGDVLERLRSGDFDRIGGATAKRVADHLNLVAFCIDETGFNWNAYRTAVALDCFPLTLHDTAVQFVSALPEAVEELLESHGVSMRAADIFRHRTGRDARDRKTLHQVSEVLGTFASTIKREETVFLTWLNDVLVGREFWKLGVWLEDAWLAWWAEALETFEQCGNDYDRFADNLAWRWRLTGKEIKVAAPTLWAVFTGYPDGRRSAYHSVLPAAGAGIPMGRIRLQGFRRMH